MVPDVLSAARENMGQEAPDITENIWGESGSCAWGDAATVIPWTVYQFYGDKTQLEEKMCIRDRCQQNGGMIWGYITRE